MSLISISCVLEADHFDSSHFKNDMGTKKEESSPIGCLVALLGQAGITQSHTSLEGADI